MSFIKSIVSKIEAIISEDGPQLSREAKSINIDSGRNLPILSKAELARVKIGHDEYFSPVLVLDGKVFPNDQQIDKGIDYSSMSLEEITECIPLNRNFEAYAGFYNYLKKSIRNRKVIQIAEIPDRYYQWYSGVFVEHIQKLHLRDRAAKHSAGCCPFFVNKNKNIHLLKYSNNSLLSMCFISRWRMEGIWMTYTR